MGVEKKTKNSCGSLQNKCTHTSTTLQIDEVANDELANVELDCNVQVENNVLVEIGSTELY